MTFWKNLALYNLLNSKDNDEVIENACLCMMVDKMEEEDAIRDLEELEDEFDSFDEIDEFDEFDDESDFDEM